MKEIIKNIKKGNYFEAYNELRSLFYDWNIDNIMRDMKKLGSKDVYCFLMYAISRNETENLHKLACELLLIDPYFHFVYPLIYWHANKALIINENYIDMKVWIVNNFYNNPDSPFGEDELCEYADNIVKSGVNSNISIEILKKHDAYG